MTNKDLVHILNGREYGSEISKAENKIIKESGLLVCIGGSDDTIIFYGIVDDESYISTNKITNNSLGDYILIDEENLEKIEDIESSLKINLKIPSITIKAIKNPAGLDANWLMTTKLPHLTFDIMDEGSLYCRGIIIESSEIKKALNNQ